MDNEQKLQDYNIQTNTQGEPQEKLPERANDHKNIMKQVLIIASIILGSITLFFVIILPAYKNIKSMFAGPSLSEYESYLAKKYTDDTFYYVSGDPSCGWFDSGFCQVLFSSASLNDVTFKVVANHYDNVFWDNYYETKYDFNIKDYYYEKYGGRRLENVISQLTSHTARATLVNPTESSTLNGSFSSFNDFLTKLEQQGNDNIEVYLEIGSADIDIYNLGWINYALIDSEVSKVIEQNDLKLASVKLIVENYKTGYTGICPKEFDHTIRGAINIVYNNNYRANNYRAGEEDNPDGRSIKGCLRTIYSKT